MRQLACNQLSEPQLQAYEQLLDMIRSKRAKLKGAENLSCLAEIKAILESSKAAEEQSPAAVFFYSLPSKVMLLTYLFNLRDAESLRFVLSMDLEKVDMAHQFAPLFSTVMASFKKYELYEGMISVFFESLNQNAAAKLKLQQYLESQPSNSFFELLDQFSNQLLLDHANNTKHNWKDDQDGLKQKELA